MLECPQIPKDALTIGNVKKGILTREYWLAASLTALPRSGRERKQGADVAITKPAAPAMTTEGVTGLYTMCGMASSSYGYLAQVSCPLIPLNHEGLCQLLIRVFNLRYG